MRLAFIISGAQTGADRGGLEAAMRRGYRTGGWVPRGRRAEDGQVPAGYQGLLETDESGYPPRTLKNVLRADVTLLFTYGPPKGGSKLTAKLCTDNRRQYLHVDLRDDDEEVLPRVVEWLRTMDPETLNVAGSRESSAPGIQKRVADLLSDAFRLLTPGYS